MKPKRIGKTRLTMRALEKRLTRVERVIMQQAKLLYGVVHSHGWPT